MCLGACFGMDELPRDLYLSIVGRLDMDGRIVCGVVGKIRPPAHLVDRMGKVLAFKAFVVATNSVWMLSHPYSCFMTDVGQSEPAEWLDRWHAHELPQLHAFLNVFRNPKYAWMMPPGV